MFCTTVFRVLKLVFCTTAFSDKEPFLYGCFSDGEPLTMGTLLSMWIAFVSLVLMMMYGKKPPALLDVLCIVFTCVAQTFMIKNDVLHNSFVAHFFGSSFVCREYG